MGIVNTNKSFIDPNQVKASAENSIKLSNFVLDLSDVVRKVNKKVDLGEEFKLDLVNMTLLLIDISKYVREYVRLEKDATVIISDKYAIDVMKCLKRLDELLVKLSKRECDFDLKKLFRIRNSLNKYVYLIDTPEVKSSDNLKIKENKNNKKEIGTISSSNVFGSY